MGGKIVKVGESIKVNSHAEFLNKVFGTNYKAWMKCVWPSKGNNYGWIVWMVRFNETHGGFINTFVGKDKDTIKEENLCHVTSWEYRDRKKIVFQVVDHGYTREYIFRGKFIYDEERDDPLNVRYYHKVSDML